MTDFTLWALLLGLLALLFLLVPAWRFRADSTRGHEPDLRLGTNVEHCRQALQQLEQDLADGAIEQSEYEAARLRLQRELLASNVAGESSLSAASPVLLVLMVLIAIAVALAATWLYRHQGGLTQLQIHEHMRAVANSEAGATDADRLILKRLLEQQIKTQPQRMQYHGIAAQMAMQDRDYPRAAELYAAVAEQFPDDAGALAFQAQALYLAGNRAMTAEVDALADAAVRIDPLQATVWGMRGMHAFSNGDYANAAEAWEKVLQTADPMSPNTRLIQQGVARARQLADTTQPNVDVAAAEGPVLTVDVSIDPQLQPALPDLPDSAVLFVFAQAENGPRVPLAVARLDPRRFPQTVRLDDSMAMMESMKLSAFDRVQVGARISRAGAVAAVSGDMEGRVAGVDLSSGAASVSVVIDSAVP